MKKTIYYVAVALVIAVGLYIFFVKGSGGFKVEQITTTKSGGSTTVSKSSTSKAPVAGLVLEKGDLKVTVTTVSDDQVTFTANINKNGSGNCVPGNTNETFNIKKGEKTTLLACNNADISYNISF